MKNLKNIYYKSCAALTVSVLASGNVLAADDIKEVTKKVSGNLEGVIDVIKVVSYIAGLSFGIAGLLKLKEYMDKPGQGQGIQVSMGRLLIGALFLSLPALLKVFASSTVGDAGSISIDEIDIS
ncbi:MAG: hypothetical protein N4A43_02180 [Alphaproteobacteria bacterium]|jgi:hypothetical protein|nr:hypothetical protein [Alphaproteobacteria bacterium]